MQTFCELEKLQSSALASVKNQAMESLTQLLSRQALIMDAITQEKMALKPYLDQWESLDSQVREKFRSGKAGEILVDLEKVANSIQAKHQEMFGAEESKSENLSQTINIYRAMH